MRSENFLVLEANEEEIIYVYYFYAPANVYHVCSLDQILAKFNFLYFLYCQGAKHVEANINLLEQVADLEDFYQHFQELYFNNDNVCLAENDRNSEVAMIDLHVVSDNSALN